ncbi:MAG: TIGR02266 family protein [Deltaproteobacteria bacterium]|nr:TIGR02266 family protein [Deltaproteobacteria bacterium]
MRDWPRKHHRAPAVLEVEFRTAGAFLVAYSSNLSKGGIFLEMDPPLPQGTKIGLRFHVPGGGEAIEVAGRVAWVRERGAPGEAPQPVGVGVEFGQFGVDIGEAIDRIVGTFSGIRIATLAELRDRAQLGRIIKSALSCQQLEVGDPDEARHVFAQQVELLIAVLTGQELEDDDAVQIMRLARAHLGQPIPTIALVSNAAGRAHAEDAGADEILEHPPALPDLQAAVVRLIGRPAAIR